MKPDFLPEQMQRARALCDEFGVHRPDDIVAVATTNRYGMPSVQDVPAWWLYVRSVRRFERFAWNRDWTYCGRVSVDEITHSTDILWIGPVGFVWRVFGRLPDMVEVLGAKRKPAAAAEERAA